MLRRALTSRRAAASTYDFLVELEVQGAGLPSTWPIRAIRYKRGRGHEVSTLLTSLVDAERYPAKEIIALYHERWELKLGYDEIKTHLLERQEAIRSRSPEGVRQELWGIALAYNLVRLEMERIADEAEVAPTRIIFTNTLFLMREEISRMGGDLFAPGTIPKRLQDLRRNLKTCAAARAPNRTSLPARRQNQDEQLHAKKALEEATREKAGR